MIETFMQTAVFSYTMGRKTLLHIERVIIVDASLTKGYRPDILLIITIILYIAFLLAIVELVIADQTVDFPRCVPEEIRLGYLLRYLLTCFQIVEGKTRQELVAVIVSRKYGFISRVVLPDFVDPSSAALVIIKFPDIWLHHGLVYQGQR